MSKTICQHFPIKINKHFEKQNGIQNSVNIMHAAVMLKTITKH